MAEIVNPLKGVAGSISTGLELGAKMSEVKMQQEAMVMKKEKFKMQKNTYRVNLLTKITNDAKKLKFMSPAVAKAAYKRMEKNLIDSEIPLSEEFKAMALDRDPEAILKFSKGLTAVEDGIVTHEQGEEAQTFIDSLSTDEFMDVMLKASERRSKQAMLDANMAMKFNDKDYARNLKERKFNAKIEEQDRKRVDKYKTDVGKIASDFRAWDVAGSQIGLISDRYKKTGKIGAQDKVTLVRQFSALTEARKSVVRQNEYDTIAGAAGLWDKVTNEVKKLVKGSPIPDKVATDIMDTYGRYRKSMKSIKRAAFSPTWNALRQTGLTKYKSSVFGEYQSIFKTPRRTTRRRVAPKAKAPASARSRALSMIKKLEAGGKKLTPAQKLKVIKRFK